MSARALPPPLPHWDHIETYLGKRFRPLSPQRDDISVIDIAHALSHQCRFSGHTKFHYSVAQHSVLVSKLLWAHSPDVQLWGLLHDASEAYLVDLPTPLKVDPRLSFYRTAEENLMRVVCDHFRLPFTEPAAVRKADAVMLATEVRDLMPGRGDHWAKLTEKPDPQKIQAWTPEVSKDQFLRTFVELTGGIDDE